MDFGFTETQEMLRKAARDFLAHECPKTVVREMAKDGMGYRPDLWHKMAGLGWMGLAFGEQYGGSEGTFLDLTVLLEEMGRALLPGPFFSTVVLGGMTILDAGGEKHKMELLPQVARGNLILTTALTEPSAKYTPDGIRSGAVLDGDDYVISGTKLFVPDAHIADYIIYVARTEKGTTGEPGLSLFLVDAKSPGIACTLLKSIAGDKQCEVTFNNVRISRINLLGDLNRGWHHIQRMLHRAAVGKCAEMVGGAQRVLEMTIEYAKQRVQFGHPIGSFQSIQNYCVQMLTDLETSRFLTYQASWKISQGLPHAGEVAIAKAWVSDAYKRITALGHQCLGGVGYMEDHEMPLYTTRAKADELAFGDADFHREMLAQELGL